MTYTIYIPGRPATKGSTVSFKHPATGKVVTPAAVNKKLQTYEGIVAVTAKQEIRRPLEGPVSIECCFGFARPKKHFRSNGQLREDAPSLCTTRRDVDKLARALLDGLTGVAFIDDSQVFHLVAVKEWAERDGTLVFVTEPEP